MTRVLIVDDHKENLALLRAMLHSRGFEVDAAGQGAEALQKARELPPDLVISDLLMPVMDGYQLLSHWKADERLQQIPFVVFTASFTSPGDEKLALDLGADAFIHKPIRREDFLAQIDGVLEKFRRDELVAGPPRVVSEPILLREYNAVLVRKLGEKVDELKHINSALCDDIARREEAEAALRLFIEFAPAAIAMFDREMRYLAVSRRWIEDYHLADRDIIGCSHYEIFPELPQRWKEVHRRCLAGAVERADAEPFPRGDGSVDWVRWEVHPWRTADGAIGGLILFSEVITERVSAEAGRLAASARFEKMFRGAPEAISISELESGRFLEVNEAFCQMFDYSREVLLGSSALELDLWSSPERRDMVIGKLRAGERVQSMEGRARTCSGEFRETLFSADRIDFGGMPCLLLMFIDISERKRAEEALGVSRARLEAMTRRLLEVQETERRAIARELHDEVGGALTAVKLNLQALRRAHTVEQGDAALLDGLALVDGAIRSVRSLSLDLRPAVLDDLGLIPALKWYGERQAQRSGVAIEMALDAVDLKAAPQLESACFRIVQEAVTNALRHAGAQHIRVALRRDDGQLAIEVADDGGGFDVAAARRRGLAGETGGLLGMEERAALLGGCFGIDSAPGAGASVRAEFALPEDGFA